MEIRNSITGQFAVNQGIQNTGRIDAKENAPINTSDSFGRASSEKMNLIDPASVGEIKASVETGLKITDLAAVAAQTTLEAALRMSGSQAAAFPGLIQAMKIKDDYTGWHVQRVADMSLNLAEALNLPPEETAEIHKAAALHDVGKIMTPISILNKPGALSDEEFGIMKQHAADTEKLLTGVTGCVDKSIIDTAKSHHERWDGKGYPNGLKGEQIPLGARIIAIADTYDAITSDRPYRKGAPKEKALEIINQNSGTQFEPKLVEAFMKMMN
jgi:HD-GYP domain-containing protein (c-di-GMP phosphodiesterase class II)